uniref:ornithine decarboxylase n=1 Tax=Steinernema glaseri TaxID=37863 RepID=A0A1I7ZUY6_9BILA
MIKMCASKLAAVYSSSPIPSTETPRRSLPGETMNSLRFETIGAKKVAVFDESPGSDDEVAQRLALLKSAEGDEDPFAVCNVATVVERFVEWRRRLPRVEPFYAVKCNDDLTLMSVLASLGAGFDCASKAEIDVVLDNKLTQPERIVYANPCKTRSFVKHAETRGITMMTFDNEEELLKVSKTHANPQMILRIAVSDHTAQCPLNVKFGSEPVNDAPRLLLKAKSVGIKVIGISFHVGSGCNDPSAFREAVCHAKRLFDIGQSLGHPMDLLDIGGGYPGAPGGKVSFAEIAEVVGGAIDEFFPEGSGVRIIAEPGRYFAAAPFSLITNVISTARVPASRITNDPADEDKEGYMYYMNDGVYGSFNCILYDHMHPTGAPLFESFDDEFPELFPTTIWGPTCDGLDQVEVSTKLRRLAVGDWLLYRNMGAYTMAAASTFNGFEKPQVYYFMDNATWKLLSNQLAH